MKNGNLMKHANLPVKHRRRIRTRDAAVVGVCLAGAVISLNLFRMDLFQTMHSQTAQPVGTITFKYNTAQRRLADRVLWDRLSEESPVYNGDLIRTSEMSEASIHIPGKAKIALNENTLIQIHVISGKETEIDLSEGALSLASEGGGQGASGNSLVINAGGSRLEASPDAVLSAESNAEGLVVQVAEGSALLAGADGSREAAAGTVISLDASGVEQAKPAAAVYVPHPNARFLNSREEDLRVVFLWNRINLSDNEVLRLEAAADKNFSRIRGYLETSGSTAQLDFPPGSWYWRLVTAGANTLASGKLSVLRVSPPSLITPASSAVYHYRTKFPPVRFQWAAVPGAYAYVLDAADNPAFSDPALASRVQGTSFETSSLGAGTWYWRVTPVFSSDYEGAAEAASSSFRIDQSGSLAAPALVFPEPGGSVNIASGKDIYFSWRKENEAASYTIRIGSNSDLREPVIMATVENSFFAYKRGERGLQAGQYYWAVFQTDSEGNTSPSSAASPFTVRTGEIIQRPVFPPDNYVITENLLTDMRFIWKSNYSQESRFQVSSDPGFSRLLVNEPVLGETFYGRPLPPGTYYWRIWHPEIESQSRRFTAVSLFPPPVPESPPPEERIVIRGRGNEPVVFRWQPVQGADYYLFKLYEENNRAYPLREQNTKITAVEFPASIFSNGAYYWNLQAAANEGPLSTRRAGHAGEERFFIRQIRPLTLSSPPEIAGLTALRTPTVLRWNTDDTVTQSRFILSRTSDPLRGTPVQEIFNPPRIISLNRLAGGTYYWTVTAETDDGFDISAETPLRLNVLPVPPLPELELLEPADGYVIGPAELRASRKIVFNWGESEGANAYIFRLFHETGTERRLVLETKPERRQSLTLEDLKILDKGTFVWQIEAVTLGAGGLVDQQSAPAESRFILDLTLPKRIETETSGILYGK
jgi:hypothetical protein